MENKDINFLEYIGHEERNFLTSMANFRQEFELFATLDDLFQKPIQRLQIDPVETLVAQLYRFVHYHLFFSVSCTMRCHISEAFASMRKGIDATLAAYYMVLNPDSWKGYVNRDKFFIYLKSNIQRQIEKDTSKYPLAKKLLGIHQICSRIGSHADFDTFIHRQKFDKNMVSLSYFQFPQEEAEFRFYLICVLKSFWEMFMVFKESFFDKKLKIIDPEWERKIILLGQDLEKRGKRYAQLSREEAKPLFGGTLPK